MAPDYIQMSYIEKLDFTGDNPQPRFGHTVTFIDKHRAILFGGAVGDTGKYVITGDIFLCETLNKKFRKLDPKGSAPSNRAAHATVFLDDVLYIYGGALGGGDLADDNLYMLNIRAGEDRAVWSVKSNQPITPGRRYGHVMAFMKPFLVVFGGNTGTQPVNDVWVLDIISGGNWTSVNTGTEVPCPRVYHSAAVCKTKTGTANGMLVVFGGRTTDQSALNDTWGLRKHKNGRLDWVKAPIKQGCQPPSARYQHSLLFLGTLMLVVGGRNNQVGESLPFDIYNTETSEWHKLQSIEKFRHAAWIMENYLYVHGGFDQDSPNVPTEKLLRVDLAKAFLPYPSLLQELSWETGKDLNAVAPQVHHHPQRVATGPNQLTASYPQSSQSFQRVREDRKGQTTSKPIRLCNEAVVVSFDEQILRKVAIDKLQEENRRLTDPIVIPQPKAYLEKIYNGILGAYFMKPTPNNAVINVDLVYSLVQEVDKVISEQSTILRLRAPLKVFGDIHGQLGDLNRLFQTFGAPTDQQPFGDIESTDYLFLGDYVDRGNKSLEVVLLLFALKLKYPENVHLLRGSHEDLMINKYMGFGDECATKLNQNIDTPNSCFLAINKVFQKLPLAAIVQKNILCVHGGIGTTMKSLAQLQVIPRQIDVVHQPKSLSQKILHEVLWSDPTPQAQNSLNTTHDYFKNRQTVKFGQNRTNKFCIENSLGVIIRSHEPVFSGVSQTGNVVTVFSCTDYCGQGNDAGVVVIKRTEELAPKIMPNVPGKKEARWLALDDIKKPRTVEEQVLRALNATPPRK